jgi:TPP-dependent pyruvate/acetoin dehydrogenase alpha subunit
MTPSDTAASDAEHDAELLVSLLERMLLIRRFEERIGELFRKNKLPGFVHLYIGEEATAVGVCSVLRNNDFLTSTHRGHGHVIAKGGDVNRMMAELFGKATGYCQGKGGSMHITDMSIGMLGANGIVSAGLPIAVGAAYGSARLRKTDQVAVAFFGDGATNEGPFHEALNMAAAWSLPVVFACENNYYGIGTRLDRISPTSDLLVRAGGYKMRAVSVDGNDVLETRAAALEAVAHARAGAGPTFIECRTFRQRGHFEGETPTYWEAEEREYWLSRDPIDLLRRKMTEDGLLDDDRFQQLDDNVRGRIEQAVAFAESSPEPELATALDDVYA